MTLLSLVAKLSVDSSAYESGLQSAEKSAQAFSGDVSRQLTAAEKSTASAMGDSTDHTNRFGTAMKNAGDESESFATRLKNALTSASKIAVTALGGATIAVGKLIQSSVSSYAENEQLVGGVETLFETSADKVKAYANSAYESAGISANKYMETVTGFAGALIQSTGRGTQTNIEELTASLNEELEATKRTLDDSYDARKLYWDQELAYARKIKAKNLDDLKKQCDAELKALKRGHQDQLKALKEANKKRVAEAEQANQRSVKSAESLDKAAELANRAIIDMSDNANKMGTNIDSIMNAYAGFSKGNFTMLDNLKLGYGGTKEEMERLLATAQEISGIKYDVSSYADIVEAIHVVQKEMGITGTTAEEASTTIQGSLASIKAAWDNVLVAMSGGSVDLGESIDALVNTATAALSNLIPAISKSLSGVSQLVKDAVPVIVQALPGLISDLLPNLISTGMQLMVQLGASLPSIVKSLWGAVKSAVKSFAKYIEDALFEQSPDIGFAFDNALYWVRLSFENLKQLWNNTLKPMIDSISKRVTEVLQPAFEAFNNFLSNTFGTVLETIGGALQGRKKDLEKVHDVLDKIKPILDGVAVGLVIFKGGLAIEGIIATFNAAISGATGLFAAFNAVLAANPILAVVTVLGALIAMLVSLYNSNEEFRNKVNWFWNDFLQVPEKVETLKKGIQEAADWIQEKWQYAVDFVTKLDWAHAGANIYKGLTEKFDNFSEKFAQLFRDAKTLIEDIDWLALGKTVLDHITSPFVTIGDWFKQKFTEAVSAIGEIDWVQLGKDIWENIKKGFADLADWFKSVFDLRKYIKKPDLRVTWYDTGFFGLQAPSFDLQWVEWYGKAYDNPILFTQPTIIPTASGYKGFGERGGGEVVLSEKKLRELTGGGTNNITINVYPQPGQDEEEIARLVEERLTYGLNLRAGAYA